VKLDTAEYDQVVRRQTRIGWWLAIICGAAAVALGVAAYLRGTVLGLHLDAAWRLPFALGMSGYLTYLTRRALQTRIVATRGGIVERTVRPRAFYLYVAFMAALACTAFVLIIVILHLDPTRSRGG